MKSAFLNYEEGEYQLQLPKCALEGTNLLLQPSRYPTRGFNINVETLVALPLSNASCKMAMSPSLKPLRTTN